MINQKGKIELQKKVHRSICERDITFLTARTPFYVFLLLSLSTPSHFPSDTLAVWPLQRYTYIAMSGILYNNIYEKTTENMKIYNLILYASFYKQRFFSTHPLWCLAFSWIELQMLLRCCLIHITIIIRLIFYI